MLFKRQPWDNSPPNIVFPRASRSRRLSPDDALQVPYISVVRRHGDTIAGGRSLIYLSLCDASTDNAVHPPNPSASNSKRHKRPVRNL